jgi:transcriptional regulator with XRE-family HTH domain
MAFNRHALTALRIDRQMTKSRFAVKAQVSNAYLTELECGDKKRPSIRVVRRLAQALRIDARVLDPTLPELKRDRGTTP